jgi:chromosome partitioning protein
MAIKIVNANWKGGVAKSTTTQAIGMMATILGEDYLIADTDPQANTTYAFGYNSEKLTHTIYSFMKGKSSFEETVLPTYYDPKSGSFFDPNISENFRSYGLKDLTEAHRGPDLLPGSFLSSNADTDFAGESNWTKHLRKAVKNIEGRYDGIVFDTNPSLGKMTVSALSCADYLVIPSTPEPWPLIGTAKLATMVLEAYESNPDLRIAGMLFTKVGFNNKAHNDAMEMASQELLPQLNNFLQTTFTESDYDGECPFSVRAFDAFVYESSLISEAVFNHSNVMLSKPRDKRFGLSYSTSALAYWSFYAQLLSLVGGQQANIKKIASLSGYLKTLYEEQKNKRSSKKGIHA